MAKIPDTLVIDISRIPEAGSFWRHFKSNRYAIIITVAKHTETGEDMIVYSCFDTNDDSNCGVYVRPLSMFLSEVDHDKYPNVKQKYCFERISNTSAEWSAKCAGSEFMSSPKRKRNTLNKAATTANTAF